MKSIRLILVFILCAACAFAQPQERYSRAKIYLNAKDHTIRDLSALGVAVDHGEYKKNTFFITDFSATELKAIRKAGFKVQIIIKDVSKHYRDQNKQPAKGEKTTTSTNCNPGPALDAPAHFHLGSYGGYFTYTEMLTILDSMQLLYPGLISVRTPIDTFHSIEGRPIYWVRVSNNPSVDQPAKPQMLYTALHHAREPGTISSTIYYLWYLLEHYNTDPHIKTIIDNTELYFVPCVNPDGLLYNISTNPTGGGLWRKNRRINADATKGVDLNRNYGFNWGYDNIGSSPMTNSETYRGTAGFSEPETQAMKFFGETHHFKTTLNYHTYGNDLIYPWGYIGSLLTPDSSQFVAYGSFLTDHTPYRYGTGDQTVGYVTNGDSDDWGYGEQTTKNKILSMTPETGLSDFGFYTPSVNIIPDCINNLRTNINAATLLLPFASLTATDEKISTALIGQFHYDLQRLGYPDTATFTVSATSLDSRLVISPTPHVYTGLTMLQTIHDSIGYVLDAATPNGALIRYELKIDNGYYVQRDTISFYRGRYTKDVEPATNTLTDWSSNNWSVCNTIHYTSSASLGSSATPCSNYDDNVSAALQLIDTVDLSHAIHSFMYFYCRWGIESSYDYLVVEASPIGVNNWQPLCGRYTKPGTANQLSGEPIYDGQHPDWAQEEMNLSDYLGSKINVRFTLVGDGGVNYSGFYLDKMNIISILDSTAAMTEQVYTAISTPGEVIVSPNPATNNINITVITFGTRKPVDVTLYDCLGRKVMSGVIKDFSINMNTRDLPAGIYYLKTQSSEAVFPMKKIEIQH